MGYLLKFKKIYLIVCILSVSMYIFSQHNPLKPGEILSFNYGKFNVVNIESSSHTPIQKTSAENGRHFILISLRALKIEEKREFSSIFFTLTDRSSNTFTEPGAWGKIEIMGSFSNFEATKGATVYVRKTDELLNLIFEVPKNIPPNQVSLVYEEKKTNTSN